MMQHTRRASVPVLEEHMSSVHERSEVHSCGECGAAYSRFRGLRRHLAAKHGKQITKSKDMPIETQTDGHEKVAEFANKDTFFDD
ncbi:Uncharacterized protein OBRU01_00545 [Operophtera brumata]|uniref:C2H2-type domain-containing protein n=1 Tax=Operophtera brumata TaxID=104452 RepID=A0A0L7LV14_OPEBR|nr:Uncharacterized protein OBRU01_00545 [Operophtera brumata]